MKKTTSRGLGSGLGALLGEGVFEEENGSSLLPIEKVEPRDDQPRSYFSPEALQTLADSISRHGLIQPITVRRMDNGTYQIIAGERRWRASRLAGLSDIPAHIIDADDREAMELALVENLQREDLNPIEEATGYRTLIKQYGLTQDEVAQRVGKSRPAVANSMRLLNLPDQTRELVASGEIAFSQARALLELDSAEAIDRVAQVIVKNGLNARDATALIKREKNGKNSSLPIKKPTSAVKNVDYAAALSERLTRGLGRKVTVSAGKKGGSVTIDYYDNDDLQSLIEQICADALD